jgi:hypothetical protein
MTKIGFLHGCSSAIFSGLVLLIAGCCPTPKEAYFGPTLPMTEVVRSVNGNNEQIPSLFANMDFAVDIVDEHGKTSGVSGSGVLNYRRPGDLLVRGSKDFVGPIFEIGSNKESYWLQLIPQVETAWYGYYANLGKPCVRPLPIQPDMLVEVLGISTFNTNFLAQPVPVMVFDHENDAYVFTWSARLDQRWAAKKQITYDRKTLQPTRVRVFDENGRTILRADLSSPKPIEVADVPQDRWPKIATKYEMYFPQTQTHLSLSLFDAVLKKGRVPNDLTFRMPEGDRWGVKKENVIEVDKDCDR